MSKIANVARKYALLCLVVICLPAQGLASAEQAKDFVQGISDKTLAIVTSGSDVKQKESKLQSLFKESVDTDWISRFVLGRYWKQASADQQKKYQGVYMEFLINSYVPKFKQYTNQKIVIKKFVEEEAHEYLVQTEIISPDSPTVRVDYRVRESDSGAYKIFDVVAEGISLITTQRSEFGSIVARSGMDSLIEQLQAKSVQSPQGASNKS